MGPYPGATKTPAACAEGVGHTCLNQPVNHYFTPVNHYFTVMCREAIRLASSVFGRTSFNNPFS